MKKLLAFACALALAGTHAASAQTFALNTAAGPREAAAKPAKPAIKWQKTQHDFGQIKQAVPVTATFEFVNTGSAPLVIAQVQGSCGCTATNYSTEPIQPGKSSKIVATYNAASPGVFNKTVTVTTSTDASAPQVLTLRGTVIANAN